MIKKISVADLRPGMYLHELCGSWMQHPFWRTKFEVKADAIGQIIGSGITEVMIDTDKGLDVMPVATPAPAAAAAPAPAVQAARPAQPPSSFAEEAQRARKVCETAKRAVALMLREARMGQAISQEVVGPLVQDIADSVARNAGALISLARLKTADDYTYMHSVAVCALMVALGRQLGLSEDECRAAGEAGLLHDLGKAMVPIEILNKPGKLTDDEFTQVKTHPRQGYDLLVKNGAAGEAALDVCLHHHEKMDGTGYPDRLKGEEISLMARMGAVCDVYDAITSNRPYKAGWDPAEAIRRMTEWSEGHFDKRVFQAFVKSVGIYPTGSLVRLASGRLAVVMEQSGGSLLKPTVKAFFSIRSCVYVTPEIIDLSRTTATDKIVGIEDPAAWEVQNLERLWMP
jgi:HD-GYP domain-containing protein (c-di-GMP phosphodiesterase class II)